MLRDRWLEDIRKRTAANQKPGMFQSWTAAAAFFLRAVGWVVLMCLVLGGVVFWMGVGIAAWRH